MVPAVDDGVDQRLPYGLRRVLGYPVVLDLRPNHECVARITGNESHRLIQLLEHRGLDGSLVQEFYRCLADEPRTLHQRGCDFGPGKLSPPFPLPTPCSPSPSSPKTNLDGTSLSNSSRLTPLR